MKIKLRLSKLKILGFIIGLASYLRLAVVLIALVVFALLAFFLYKNLYLTITQSEEIILLKQEVAPDTIDMDKVNKSLEALEKKATTTIDWSKIKSPFDSYGPQPVANPTGID